MRLVVALAVSPIARAVGARTAALAIAIPVVTISAITIPVVTILAVASVLTVPSLGAFDPLLLAITTIGAFSPLLAVSTILALATIIAVATVIVIASVISAVALIVAIPILIGLAVVHIVFGTVGVQRIALIQARHAHGGGAI
jgi:hypothetical protein